jgi:4'-phosphopantetheinyl transferase
MPAISLASGEVHSWCVRLDVPPETAAGCCAALTDDERNRSARLRFTGDWRRFVVTRGVLRELLGRYLRTNPGEVRFVYNPFGKPALSPEFGSRLTFNVSHSGDLALIAIATDSDIGVDLECIREQPDYVEIARRFFSAAEAEQLTRLPSQIHAKAFLSCWTKKEAYVKARGEGLALLCAEGDFTPARGWSLYTLLPAPGYVGALVIRGSGWHLTQWRWQMAPSMDHDCPPIRSHGSITLVESGPSEIGISLAPAARNSNGAGICRRHSASGKNGNGSAFSP